MDTGCAPRQPATDLSHCSSLVRPGIHNANPCSPGKLTASADQAGPLRSGDDSSYVLCSHCGQVSHNLRTCDFCSKVLDANVKVHYMSRVPQDCKRRLPTTAPNHVPCKAKLAKGTFYGSRTGTTTQVTTTVSLSAVEATGAVTVVKKSSLLAAASVDGAGQAPGSALVVARAVPATNGRSPLKAMPTFASTARQLLSTAGHTPAKLGRAVGRRGRREPECLTISSDEEMDVECQEEVPRVITNHHVTTTTATRESGVVLSKDVHCPLRESPHPVTPTVVVLTSQSSPPSSPLSSAGGTAASPDSTSVAPSTPRGVGRVRATPVGPPPGGLPDSMRFRCRSIRVGSHKVAAGHHWVTATKAGFEFTLRTVQNGERQHLKELWNECVCRRKAANRSMLPSPPEKGLSRHLVSSRPPARAFYSDFLVSRDLWACMHSQRRTGNNESCTLVATVEPGYIAPGYFELLFILNSPNIPLKITCNSIGALFFCKGVGSSNEAAASPGASVLLPQSGSSSGVTHVVVHNIPTTSVGSRATRTSSNAGANCQQATSAVEVPSGPNIKLLVYPPPPKTGGIAVHRADLRCLGEAQFLNDVIIDFYLKYLMQEKVCEEVQRRTHVFSSFFYPRLTQRLNHRAQGQAGLT
ncbi:unnamed protein product [Ixodes pacificus]